MTIDCDEVWYPYQLHDMSFDVERLRNFETEQSISYPESYVDFVARRMGMSLVDGHLVLADGERSAGFILGFVALADDGSVPRHTVENRHRHLVHAGFRSTLVPFMGKTGGDIVFDFGGSTCEPSIAYIEPELEGEEAVIPVSADFAEFLRSGLFSAI